MSVPQVSGVCPPNEYETFESQQVASDCLWSDPAKGDQVGTSGSVVPTGRFSDFFFGGSVIVPQSREHAFTHLIWVTGTGKFNLVETSSGHVSADIVSLNVLYGSYGSPFFEQPLHRPLWHLKGYAVQSRGFVAEKL